MLSINTLSGIYQDLQDIFLTKLLGRFNELHNTQFFHGLKSLTRNCIAPLFRIVFLNIGR